MGTKSFTLAKARVNHPMEDYHVVEFVPIEGKQIGFIICYFAMTTWGTLCLCTYRNIFQHFKETYLVCAHVCF
ncbi:transmembrane protein, putative [Medicago truncatula]|uniref:Transmembrane protein, putative n=1 Tax=Medicago truncatula TaxID=3880 RepID=G7LGI1_MEDTR|nr:transmembrane protein, putative [Medicago truncatula]